MGKKCVALFMAALLLCGAASPALALEEPSDAYTSVTVLPGSDTAGETAPAEDTAGEIAPAEEPVPLAGEDAPPAEEIPAAEDLPAAELPAPEPVTEEPPPAETSAAPAPEATDPAETDPVAPEEDPETALVLCSDGEPVSLDVSDLFPLDNAEMFAAYADGVLYPAAAARGPRKAGRGLYATLTEVEQILYDRLREGIAAIAAGERASTVIAVPVTAFSDAGFATSFTEEELGVPIIGENENGSLYITAEASQAVRARFAFNYERLLAVLRSDLPYELYWFDKTAGAQYFSFSVGAIPGTGTAYISGSIRFCLPATQEYRDPENADEISYISGGTTMTAVYPHVNTALTGAAVAAAAYAREIAAENAGLTDLQKLRAYRDVIRGLTDYNWDAANDADPVYGGPWQLVWVFDRDGDTKVVCEGYSKAFAYLCQVSTLTDIDVVCAQGTLTTRSNGEPGKHMWNIVNMPDGQNYLVDVTNDSYGELFLCGYSGGSAEEGYVYANGRSSYRYAYNESTANYFGEYLAMSPADYGVAGDVNEDGRFDLLDLMRLLSWVSGESVSIRRTLADVNDDGRVDTGDLLLLLKKLVGLDVTLVRPDQL